MQCDADVTTAVTNWACHCDHDGSWHFCDMLSRKNEGS